MELLAANPSQVISTDRNVKIKAARGQAIIWRYSHDTGFKKKNLF